MEVNAIYARSGKKFNQNQHDETFQTGVLLSGHLDISFLVSQRCKHEAYSSQRMERIQIPPRYKTSGLVSNLNPNKINNMISLAQNDGTKAANLRIKRWQNRSRLETLERYQNAPGNY